MSKSEVQPAKKITPVDHITLTEFCQRVSVTVRRPELLSGFEYVERMAGRLKDSNEAFQERLDKFRKTPV